MTELVVLASPDGAPIGTADKAVVHTADTPLHFAFSAWVVRDGNILLSRRALSKKTWPGVWTNSFCGHPGPGEPTVDAVVRRAQFELGLSGTPQLVLPDFAYRAEDSSGVVENEICPVYLFETRDDPKPNPEEVDSFAWAPVRDVLAAVDATPFAFSPWMVEELTHEPLRAALLG
ncbi:isopentenyl-diphosphate Delta-isomerase [Corynebacterium minutissimum]|uniref:Isopentenyl-diphosphate Delta-isomerase n=1 Tax=Corynebacterium minutissimum TaxID=38301 RepID=A0A376D3S8_9CORY|nr:isopentenyl-diphosphate Delta-isomerase [Corynebacterium minutissimum]QRP61525.1 isopentenyl-diphosphate Delta-isomerase [Corynebacterium minutissimum]STC80142.1 isopentenyl-diphosphate delta-isomerase [Corynebacterium minutissimum]